MYDEIQYLELFPLDEYLIESNILFIEKLKFYMVIITNTKNSKLIRMVIYL